MSEKSDSEDDYEKCDHEYTIKSLGWKICVTCGLCLKRCFSRETNYNLDRVFLKNTGPDHVLEIREKMRELMGMIIREFRKCEYTGEIYYIEPPEAGLPRELWDYSEELCKTCNEYKLPVGHMWKKVKRGSPIRCQTRSLCASVLWEKVKSLYPMSMSEFAKKVGVSKPTIINTCKKMRQIDLNYCNI